MMKKEIYKTSELNLSSQRYQMVSPFGYNLSSSRKYNKMNLDRISKICSNNQKENTKK